MSIRLRQDRTRPQASGLACIRLHLVKAADQLAGTIYGRKPAFEALRKISTRRSSHVKGQGAVPPLQAG